MKCSKCREEKELDKFYFDKWNNVYHKSCKNCHNKKLISPSEYEEKFRGQFGKCAICSLESLTKTMSGKPVKLSVDHDHNTGKIRGLLCTNCNVGLGKFKDSPQIMRKAFLYLLKYQ
jgi:hypothetical protein